MQNLDLKQIERRAWTSYFEDGLWDIFFGLMMLTMGIRALTDNVWFTFGMGGAVLVMAGGKRVITVPRMGLVNFSPARKARQQKVRVVIGVSALAGLVSLLLGLLTGLAPSGVAAALIVGLLVSLVFALIAYFMEFGRLYVHGLVFATGFVLWELLGTPIGPVALCISGSAAVLTGAVVLIRFLRKYPKPSLEQLDVTA